MYVFIVNPHAGNGRAKYIFEKLQKSSLFQALDSKYYFSDYEGHAEEIAASLSRDCTVTKIIVIGGDGTISEVLNGLGECTIPISFIPGGSGNDFARGVGIKGRPEEILEHVIDEEHTIDYWLGSYTQDNKGKRYFVNSMGIGFDAQIAHIANKSFYKKYLNQFRIGTVSYIIALLQVLGKFNQKTIEITVDGEKRMIRNCWLIAIGNHPYYGGGMKIMPHAKIRSSKYAVLIVHSLPKWKVLLLFMLVFTGKHERIKGVDLLEAEHLTVHSEAELYMQVDGQTTICNTVQMTKQGQAIKIITTLP